jgi:hypothetical protein
VADTVVDGYGVPAIPEGSAAGPVMASVTPTVSEYVLVAAADVASVAVTTTLKGLPVAVDGVPVIVPVAALMLKPAGSPVADHVYGAVPPVADTVVDVYAAPTVPEGSAAGPMMASVTPTVSEYVLVTTADAVSIAVTTTLKGLPVAVVGVPVIVPVPALMLKPAGSPVADQVYGAVPPVADTVVDVYGVPAVPEGSADGPVMESAAPTVRE